MKLYFRSLLVLTGLLLVPLVGRAQGDLASKARDIMKQHCFECHGKNPKKCKGSLNLFDRAQLEDKDKKIIAAVDDSELIKRIYSKEEETIMPPKNRPQMSEDEKKILRDWIAGGGQAFVWQKIDDPEKEFALQRAVQVKEIFRARCFECHGGSKKAAGVVILDHALLVDKKKIVPGKADDSLIYQLVTATDNSVMPPSSQPKLNQADLDLVRAWINDGAPPFPPDVVRPDLPKKVEPAFAGSVDVEYVLQNILMHITKIPLADRPYIRYFSINHLLVRGTTAPFLDLQRAALTKAINHLSWEPHLVQPIPIDGAAATVFYIDLRKLGWDKYRFERYFGKYDKWYKNNGNPGSWYKSDVDLWDLALLDYPYGVVYNTKTFEDVVSEYIAPANMLLPIPYVRADWFVSTITGSPFYEDFLQLPFELERLEYKLGVDSFANIGQAIAKRAGMAWSGVSKNNRAVERHPLKYWPGMYWKSYDFRTSKGLENLFYDPVDFHRQYAGLPRYAGGEMIWTLPNGLQAYYLANNRDVRVEVAPTEIVHDKFAADSSVHNGLACMRCHNHGMKRFTDDVRPALLRMPAVVPGFDKRFALDLYPDKKEMDFLVDGDENRFETTLTKALGKPWKGDQSPLTPVSHLYLDEPLNLHTVAGELGLREIEELKVKFRLPQFIGLGLASLAADYGVIRRDAWDDYFGDVVNALGLGYPIVPLDGLELREYPSFPPPLKFAFATKDVKTKKNQSVFKQGDEIMITVKNESQYPIYVEVILTSVRGKKFIVTQYPVKVEAYKSYESKTFKVTGSLGKEQITLFASYKEFPGGELLQMRRKDYYVPSYYDYVSDRVIHRYYNYSSRDNRYSLVPFDASQLVKRTIEVETK